MSIISVPVVVLACSSFCVGAYHLVSYLLQTHNRKDLTFAWMCITIGFYDAFCVGLYNVISVAQSVQWLHLQYAALAFMNIAFIWYVTYYTLQKPRIGVYVLSIFFFLTAIVQIVDRSNLTWLADRPSIKDILLPFRFRVTYYEATPGIFTTLISPVFLLAWFYIFRDGLNFYRRGYRREADSLLIALCIVFTTGINDFAVHAGLYSSLYLIEYGSLAMTFLMAYSLWRTIEEAAKTKESLIESEVRFQTIVENSHSGILTVNKDYQLTYVNDQLCHIMGYSHDELIGKNFRLFLDEESKEKLADRYGNSKTGESALIREELNITHKDGNKRTLEMSIATNVGEAGDLYAIAQALDITDRKKIELALAQRAIENVQLYEKAQQRAEQLATLNEINRAVSTLQALDTVLEIIYQQVQRIAKVDAFYICLYDPERDEISYPLMYDLGKRYQEPNEPLEKESRIGKVILSGNPLLVHRSLEEMESPIEFGFGDKTRKAASILIVPLRLRERVTGVISIQSYTMNAYTDEVMSIISGVGYQAAIAIENAKLFTAAQQELRERIRIETQREALIKELEAKNSELEHFTYTVSHDLKSPLVTIRGFLGYIEKDALKGDFERLKSDIDRITSATDKMQRLLTELLELSRIGRMMNPPVEVSFSQLAHEAVDMVQGQIQKISAQVNIDEDMGFVFGDRARLLEVLQNLVDNATKFMGGQKEPRIDIGRDGNDADGKPIYFIQDNGIGVEPQFHERIFGLFNKLDPQSEGTGIGLTIVKRIIEVHGGRIWVESEGMGKGTKFAFTLPQQTIK